MSKHPKVSVIVPIYNTETYMEECLSSILNQTLQDIEIIRKNITYYRYKILSKIMIGKKRDKYEKKYKDLKQKIRAIRNFNKGI